MIGDYDFNILGLVGYGGSGKDFACDLIQKQLPNVRRVAFADKLKAVLKPVMGYIKYRSDKIIDKDTVRDLYVSLGTRVMRKIRADNWVEEVEPHLDHPTGVIITDVRNLNEAELIVGRGGALLYLDSGDGPQSNEELFSISEIRAVYPDIDTLLNCKVVDVFRADLFANLDTITIGLIKDLRQEALWQELKLNSPLKW